MAKMKNWKKIRLSSRDESDDEIWQNSKGDRITISDNFQGGRYRAEVDVRKNGEWHKISSFPTRKRAKAIAMELMKL
jgi:hypothetical protein